MHVQHEHEHDGNTQVACTATSTVMCDLGTSMSTIAMCICTHMREHGTQLNTHGTRNARA